MPQITQGCLCLSAYCVLFTQANEAMQQLPATTAEQAHQAEQAGTDTAGSAHLNPAPHPAGLSHAESNTADQTRATEMPLGMVFCHNNALLNVTCNAVLCCVLAQ